MQKLLKLLNINIANSARSQVVIKNIALSGFVKAVAILISVLTVPITLKYLRQSEYGLWLTIYSIMTWLMYFDGGLGSGLRNRFTESKAVNLVHKIKIYISTSYFILLCTIVFIILIFVIVNPWVDWATFLNIEDKTRSLNRTIFIIFLIFCLQFVFRLIDSILIADQRSGEADLLNMLGNAFSLLAFYFVSTKFQGSLLLVGLVFCGVPLLLNIAYTIYLFSSRYREYRPSYKCIDISYYKDLMTLGSKFFIIQICSLITLSATNVIISKVLGPSEVVTYNLAYKYFSFTLLSFTILTGSLYSSFTDAFHKDDIDWIKNTVKKIQIISLIYIGIIALMIIFSNFVYRLWVGPTVKIPMLLSSLIGLYYAVTIWCTVYSTFVSGVGKVKIAYYVAIVNSVLCIPLSVFFANNFGVVGIVITQILLISAGLYWLPRQYNKIVNKVAEGIWNK